MSTLAKRTFSTIILLALLAGSVFFDYEIRKWFFTVLCALLGFGASWECFGMLNGPKQFKGLKWFVSLALVIVVIFPMIQGRYLLSSLAIPFDTVLFTFIFWLVILSTNKNQEALRAAINGFAVFFLFSMALKLIYSIYYTYDIHQIYQESLTYNLDQDFYIYHPYTFLNTL